MLLKKTTLLTLSLATKGLFGLYFYYSLQIAFCSNGKVIHFHFGLHHDFGIKIRMKCNATWYCQTCLKWIETRFATFKTMVFLGCANWNLTCYKGDIVLYKLWLKPVYFDDWGFFYFLFFIFIFNADGWFCFTTVWINLYFEG